MTESTEQRGSSGKLERLFAAWSNLLERIFPDPFTLSLFLTILTIAVALMTTPAGFRDIVSYWGTGLWGFLEFSMQMAMILVTGQVLAEAPIVAFALKSLSSRPQSMSTGVALVGLSAMVCAWLNWGFGLIVGALLARLVADSLAEKLGEERVSRGLLGAAGYMGLSFWHGGLSGSAPLAVTVPDHAFHDLVGVLPLNLTVLSPFNLGLSLFLLIAMPGFLVFLSRSGIATTNQPVAGRQQSPDPEPSSPAQKALTMAVIGLAVLWWFFVKPGLGLNSVIFLFMFLGLAAHGSSSAYAQALDRSIGAVSGIVLQFPFYAGIVGIASKSGLVEVLSSGFVSLSHTIHEATGFQPFLLFVFLSAGAANLLVPSGGGQWMIQGPIVLKAAALLHIAPVKAVLAVSYGDEWTNLLQPFWALPLLSITGLKPAQLLSVTTLLLIWEGLIVCGALAFAG